LLAVGFLLAAAWFRGIARVRARAASLAMLFGGPAPDGRRVVGRAWKDLAARRTPAVRFGAALVGLGLGAAFIGPVGAALGAGAGAALPGISSRRRTAASLEEAERALAELVDAMSLAVRSGFGVEQALSFSAEEAGGPIRDWLDSLFAARSLGMPFDESLSAFSRAVGTDDARLFAMVLSIHHRTGGNVADALTEVATAIRARIAVRREIRALTAQGRISGSILTGLPVAFFVVMSATSHQDLGPIYESSAGLAMLAGGLALDAIAYLWVRSLLRVPI
jgi:tight adherence protein B